MKYIKYYFNGYELLKMGLIKGYFTEDFTGNILHKLKSILENDIK
jgi:hypothetical protein